MDQGLAYGDLTAILQVCLLEHLGLHGEAYAVADQALPLPEYESTGLAALVDRVATLLADAQHRRAPVAGSLAGVAVEIARTLHDEICTPRCNATRADVIACQRDATVARDALVFLAARFLDIEFCDQVPERCARTLVQAQLPEPDIRRSIDGVIATGVRRLWDRRPKPQVIPGVPAVQVNTAISDVDEDDYKQLRTTALAISDTLTKPIVRFDVTSDYARPDARYSKLVDEGAVRSAIMHAAAMVVFADHGRFGTAMTWTRGEDLLMPVLVLSREVGDTTVARYPGTLALRTVATYDTDHDAVERVRSFLKASAGYIQQRQDELLGYATRDISDLQERMNRVDISAFDSSLIPWELARFYLDSPVHWFQAPDAHREEIERRLGCARSATVDHRAPAYVGASPTLGMSVEDYDTSIRNLTRYAEIEGLTYARFDQLREVFRAEQEVALEVSSRPAPYVVADWRALDRRTPDVP